MRLIGLCGYARVGKDEAAKALVGLGWTRVAFADALKSEVCRTFGITQGYLAENKEAWRPLLVEWGRARRRLEPNYWIQRAMATASNDLGIGVVVTDVRYWNEAKYLRSLEGTIVRIHRPGFEAVNDEERTSVAEIDGAQRILGVVNIDNSGSIASLHNAIQKIAGPL